VKRSRPEGFPVAVGHPSTWATGSKQELSVFGGREDPQVAIPQPMQLRSRRKNLIEAADVRVEHHVEVLLDRSD
jgi:hypothetical protein